MKRQAKFIIRDSNFNVVEERLLDDLDIGSTNYLLNLIPSQSGGWIGVGANFEWVTDPFWAEAHVYGWTVRIDETGDTLWARNDLAFPDTAETATTVELHSVVELPSGSIIAAGYYRPFNISGPDLGVLIKVDKEGCLVNCTPLTTTEWFERPKIEIAVFPNPAGRQISLETPFPLTYDCEWSLYNAVGQQVLSSNMVRGTTRLEVPLSVVPPGLYFWEMRDLKGKIGNGKLIVSEQ
ncbi:MAG: T9SS type A sorting domain-containing protein [Saprospiraceae bacterium]